MPRTPGTPRDFTNDNFGINLSPRHHKPHLRQKKAPKPAQPPIEESKGENENESTPTPSPILTPTTSTGASEVPSEFYRLRSPGQEVSTPTRSHFLSNNPSTSPSPIPTPTTSPNASSFPSRFYRPDTPIPHVFTPTHHQSGSNDTNPPSSRTPTPTTGEAGSMDDAVYGDIIRSPLMTGSDAAQGWVCCMCGRFISSTPVHRRWICECGHYHCQSCEGRVSDLDV